MNDAKLTDALIALQAENARLVALLKAHGIEWRAPRADASAESVRDGTPTSAEEKLALFRRLFQGRTDVFPVRWESASSGKSGYSPACANDRRPGVCQKPAMKCGDCAHRQLLPVTDKVIYEHLAGRRTLGVYPLLGDDTCNFLAVDFDEADWQDDAKAFVRSCRELGVPAALEISRSGQGAHVWILFRARVPARDARRLGTALISHTCASTRQLRLASYDRLFPNQDTLPKGGLGNLIALPLQKKARERGCTVFVDEELRPYPEQWAYLATLARMAPEDIEATILRATDGVHPLDVTFVDEEANAKPWQKPAPSARTVAGPLPESLEVTLANLIYLEKAALPQPLANRLIRLAAFPNPAFYQAQAMRFSVWNIARVIGCAENFRRHIGLPRGCLDAVSELLKENGVRLELHDERYLGTPIDISFTGILRIDQEAAVAAMLHHDTGVLCAPTAFGKTVTAAAMIARRGVNTLILVHRTELLKQWQARLDAFLATRKGDIGVIIFMQCGPIRYIAATPEGAPRDLQVIPKMLSGFLELPDEAGIQDVFRCLANDPRRTAIIVDEARQAFEQGRKVLILTERTDHIQAIYDGLSEVAPALFMLHGRMSRKQRATVMSALEALPAETPRILLATGKLVGEGFDHPPLDTLLLAMPISWKGTLQQYAGRLHREHEGKTDVRIIDIVDIAHPALLRMWDKRQRGYRAMGYRIAS
ncbi:DEAD/DEAH box helicase [Aromatoleum toluolicum]|uniref:DEAD/DEAH box helicase n=1 Tax=Aromatoleum toluolicum TaxID=90060 RepID=A0ABX1NAZ0_9RHOO|nr:DEAD/DEAH box helicase family protein [Aromatoleum toluolicum]NMF96456.1 DEAD/DEAH box helicase [Aromatoleum toluolicum]